MTTRKKEKPFEKLTPAQKRVRIAEDVLAQLAGRKLIAKHNVWVQNKNGSERALLGNNKQAQVCDVLSKQKQCNVCALGAIFVATVKRADRLKVCEVTGLTGGAESGGTFGGDDIFGYLGRFFNEDQLSAIETAFEGGEGLKQHSHQAKFFLPDSIEDPSDKMRLIMENIVVNKGRFNLKRRPVTVYATPGY